MSTEIIPQFSVIGLSVRTTNENQQAAKDIPALWNKFMTEGVLSKIPNKIDESIYCIYTDYEEDHTKPYTAILGCKVSSLDEIPPAMVGKNFDEATYIKYVAKGTMSEGMVYNEWLKIWNSDLPRTFIADFEIYDAKSQHPENAEVAIFVGVKQ